MKKSQFNKYSLLNFQTIYVCSFCSICVYIDSGLQHFIGFILFISSSSDKGLCLFYGVNLQNISKTVKN